MLSDNYRKIRSFVTRQGRITQGQQSALETMRDTHIINYQPFSLDLDSVFARNNPKIIEIGFGMGHATWQIAQAHPDHDYLGIEVHTPGIGSLLMLARENKVDNIKVIQHDAVEVLQHMIQDNTIHGFHIFFPDPWHKKRHHKRRLLQADFIRLLCNKLKLGGYIHIATDWEDYALWIETILTNNADLRRQTYGTSLRPQTKFEQRGLRLSHTIYDFYYIKKDF